MHKQNGWELHKTPCIYYMVLECIFREEASKQGLSWKDIWHYWYVATGGVPCGYLITTINNFTLYIPYDKTNIKSLDVIVYRHRLKQYVKEIVACKQKELINSPVNNAVGWKV